MATSAPRAAVIGAFGAIYLLWGSTYLAVALALASVPPFLLMGARSIVGGLALLVAARASGASAASGHTWVRATVCGLLLFVTCHGTLACAQQHVPSGLAAVVLATIPLWIALINAIVPGGETPTSRQLCLLAPGFIGVALIVSRQADAGSEAAVSGDLALLVGAAASWALGTILSERWSTSETAVAFSGMELTAGGTILLIISAMLGEPASFKLQAISAAALAGWVYLTVAGTIVAFAAYIWLLKQVSPTLVATYTFVNPIIAVLLGWAVLGERLNGVMAVGAVLVIGSVVGLLGARGSNRSVQRNSPQYSARKSEMARIEGSRAAQRYREGHCA